MPIIRRLLAQDDNDDNQWLKVDHSSRYVVNDMDDWQFLFGPNSSLNAGTLSTKIAAKFNEDTFDNIQIIAYLRNIQNFGISGASGCTFKIYRIGAPNWTETLIATIPGVLQSNNYFYANPNLSSLSPIDFRGGESIMIEATVTRFTEGYTDRIYVNHLGIYDNVTRLRQEVEFLDITKKDQ